MAFAWATHATVAGKFPLRSCIRVAAGEFVACGAGGKILTSADGGATWTSRTAASTDDWTGLASDGTTVVAVANAGASIRAMRSTDKGHTWVAATTVPEANTWNGVCTSAVGTFIAVSGNGTHRAMVSTDSGNTWATKVLATSAWLGVATDGAGTVVAWNGNNGANGLAVSTDGGTTWGAHTAPSVQTNLSYAGGTGIIGYSTALGKFVINGQDPGTFEAKTYTSADGVTWASPGTVTGENGFGGFALADTITGFIGSLPIDSSFMTPSPAMIGWSVNEGVGWTADNTTFSASGTWAAAAWDPTNKTVLFLDDSSATALVGTYSAATVTGLTPSYGPKSGGTVVTLTGTGLAGVTHVTFGGSAATDVVPAASGLSLTCITPAHAVGPVDVAVS